MEFRRKKWRPKKNFFFIKNSIPECHPACPRPWQRHPCWWTRRSRDPERACSIVGTKWSRFDYRGRRRHRHRVTLRGEWWSGAVNSGQSGRPTTAAARNAANYCSPLVTANWAKKVHEPRHRDGWGNRRDCQTRRRDDPGWCPESPGLSFFPHPLTPGQGKKSTRKIGT